ncbi:MAG: bifunctional oligoribonuclease/PAP phosphatase NrnA [Bacteroidota bacterium]
MKNTDFQKIASLLSTPSRILITTHTNPDGDAIGASLAFFGYLSQKNHEVRVMIPDADPEFLHWMPYHENLMIFSEQEAQCLDVINNAEIIFSVDYNSFKRLGKATDAVRKSSATKVLIDHHTLPDNDYHYMISITKTSSTSELIYDFIEASGDDKLINKGIAECIYAGIITDTGSFSYSCNYEKTYLITAALYRAGINGEHIHRLVYDTYSEDRLRLLGYSISEKLVVLPEFSTAYISLSKEDLERFHHQIGDTEDIVNYALSIKGINLAALFCERDGLVKVSLRSKGNFAVNKIARDYFNGGGHVNAAGANCYMSLDETVRILLDLLPSFKEPLKEAN